MALGNVKEETFPIGGVIQMENSGAKTMNEKSI